MNRNTSLPSPAMSISETVSETKRGRPATFDGRLLDLLRRLYPELRTRRGLTAKAFEITAVRCLVDEDGGTAIVGVDKLLGGAVYAATILEQLGRYKMETGCSEDKIVGLARQANELLSYDPTMTVRRVVRAMRVVREESRR